MFEIFFARQETSTVLVVKELEVMFQSLGPDVHCMLSALGCNNCKVRISYPTPTYPIR